MKHLVLVHRLLSLLLTAVVAAGVTSAADYNCTDSSLFLSGEALASSAITATRCAVTVVNCSATTLTFRDVDSSRINVTNIACSEAVSSTRCVYFSRNVTGGVATTIHVDGVTRSYKAAPSTGGRFLVQLGAVTAHVISVTRLVGYYNFSVSTGSIGLYPLVTGTLRSSGAAGSLVHIADNHFHGHVTISSTAVVSFSALLLGSVRGFENFLLRGNRFLGGGQSTFTKSGTGELTVTLILFNAETVIAGGGNVTISENEMPLTVSAADGGAAAGPFILISLPSLSGVDAVAMNGNSLRGFNCSGYFTRVIGILLQRPVLADSFRIQDLDFSELSLASTIAMVSSFVGVLINSLSLRISNMTLSGIVTSGEYQYSGQLGGAFILLVSSPLDSIGSLTLTDIVVDFSAGRGLTATSVGGVQVFIARFENSVSNMQSFFVRNFTISGRYVATLSKVSLATIFFLGTVSNVSRLTVLDCVINTSVTAAALLSSVAEHVHFDAAVLDCNIISISNMNCGRAVIDGLLIGAATACIYFAAGLSGAATQIYISDVTQSATAPALSGRHSVVRFDENVTGVQTINIARIAAHYNVSAAGGSASTFLHTILFNGTLSSSSNSSMSEIIISDCIVSGRVATSAASPGELHFVAIAFAGNVGGFHRLELRNNSITAFEIAAAGTGVARLSLVEFQSHVAVGDILITNGNSVRRLVAAGNVRRVVGVQFQEPVEAKTITVDSLSIDIRDMVITNSAQGRLCAVRFADGAQVTLTGAGNITINNVAITGEKYAYAGTSGGAFNLLQQGRLAAFNNLVVTNCALIFSVLKTDSANVDANAYVAFFSVGIRNARSVVFSNCSIAGRYIATGAGAKTEVQLVRFSSVVHNVQQLSVIGCSYEGNATAASGDQIVDQVLLSSAVSDSNIWIKNLNCGTVSSSFSAAGSTSGCIHFKGAVTGDASIVIDGVKRHSTSDAPSILVDFVAAVSARSTSISNIVASYNISSSASVQISGVVFRNVTASSSAASGGGASILRVANNSFAVQVAMRSSFRGGVLGLRAVWFFGSAVSGFDAVVLSGNTVLPGSTLSTSSRQEVTVSCIALDGSDGSAAIFSGGSLLVANNSIAGLSVSSTVENTIFISLLAVYESPCRFDAIMIVDNSMRRLDIVAPQAQTEINAIFFTSEVAARSFTVKTGQSGN